MRSVLTFAVVTLATLVAACASPNLDEPTPLQTESSQPSHGKSSSASSPAPSGDADGTSPAPSGSGSSAPATQPPSSPAPSSAPPAPAADAGAQAKRWRGTLGSTSPVTFGGGSECRYRITLKQVKVDIVAAANGDVVAANVTATAFEEVLSTPCNNVAIPQHTHTYALTTAAVLQNGTRHLELVGLSTNHPAASLVIEGDLDASAPLLTLQWHRTDYGPPLDWRIGAQITAMPY